MSEYLSLPLRLPDEEYSRFKRLEMLTQRIANQILQRYWTPDHLDGIYRSTHQAWTYFDEHEAFEDIALYLPSRFKRCILQKVGETLRSHADNQAVFVALRSFLPDHKIRRIHRRQIKQRLWDAEEYRSSGYVDGLIDQLNAYYDQHGRYPESYMDLQDRPTYDSGLLSYSADDGPTAGRLINYRYKGESEKMDIKIKTPDTLSPESRTDWTWTEHTINSYQAFHELLTHGDVASPEFQPSHTKTNEMYYELQFPVDIDSIEPAEDVERVLAVDGGLRKDATCIVINQNREQRSTPYFVRFTDREKMRHLHRERTRLNDRLAELRSCDRGHTEQFQHLLAEYKRVNNKISNKRHQLVHDVANQILALALLHDVDAIVHEDLRSLRPPRGEGELSWELTSWARREIINKIEDRAALAGLHVERIYPRGTSRSCPRCGKTGYTCKSPDHDSEVWWGGHFRCDNVRCGFEGDRDYIGAINIARVYFSDDGGLNTDFTTSYTEDSESVLARRSAGTRPVFSAGIVSYAPATEQSRATAGSGSTRVVPAVALPGTSSDRRDGCGPATRRYTRFHRIAAESG